MSFAQQVTAASRRAARPCPLLAPLSQRRRRRLVPASLVPLGWILFQEQPCAQQAIAAHTHAVAPLRSPRRRALRSQQLHFPLVRVSLALMDSNQMETMSFAQQVTAASRLAARPCHLLAPLSQRRHS